MTSPGQCVPLDGGELADPLLREGANGGRERDVARRDGGGARSAVGLEDVAVDPDRVLAERLEIRHGPQRAADQPLDLLRSTGGTTLADLPGRALHRRARE